MTNAERYKTVEERTKAFREYCNGMKCTVCPNREHTATRGCGFAWLELEAPLHPCPFCGGEADVFWDGLKFFVWCGGCGATPYTTDTEDKAIELWNRRAR